MQSLKTLFCILCITWLSLVISSAEARTYGSVDLDLESHIDGKIFKRIEEGKPVVVVDKPSTITLPIFLSTWGGEQPTAGKLEIKLVATSIELKAPRGITFQSSPESLVIKENERGQKTSYIQLEVTEDAQIGKYEIPFELSWEENKESSGRLFSIILNVGKDFAQYKAPDNKLFLDRLSPLKQVKLGISPLDVKCKEGFMLVIKTSDDSPACVSPLTYNKLVERGWINIQGRQETFFVFAKDTKYEIPLHVKGWKNKVLNMTADIVANSLIVDLQTKNKGELTITLPRGLIDSNINGEDDGFFVLVNGEEVNFEEKKTETSRTLNIIFPEGTTTIEIIGTMLI